MGPAQGCARWLLYSFERAEVKGDGPMRPSPVRPVSDVTSEKYQLVARALADKWPCALVTCEPDFKHRSPSVKAGYKTYHSLPAPAFPGGGGHFWACRWWWGLLSHTAGAAAVLAPACSTMQGPAPKCPGFLLQLRVWAVCVRSQHRVVALLPPQQQPKRSEGCCEHSEKHSPPCKSRMGRLQKCSPGTPLGAAPVLPCLCGCRGSMLSYGFPTKLEAD